MNMEFPIFIMIPCHFQLSFDFFLLFFLFFINIGILVGGLRFFVSLRYHVSPISVNKVLRFLLKSSGVELFTSVVIFETFFPSYFNRPNNTMQCLVQCVNPSFNKIYSNTYRNMSIYTLIF